MGLDEGEQKKTVVSVRGRDGSTAEVCLHGGHIISWKNSGGVEQLFLSKKACFKAPKAIRGGVPICFPQFADFGDGQKHGFVRNVDWELIEESDEKVVVKLQQRAGSTGYSFPDFAISNVVKLLDNGSLVQEMFVTNTGSDEFEFTTCLHNYLRVADISKVYVEGLQTYDYLDSANGRNRVTEEQSRVIFPGEVDRIYLQTPDTVYIKEDNKELNITTTNLPDTVVWNPGPEIAKGMGDLGDDDYKRFVCIEPSVISKSIRLVSGGKFRCSQTISVVVT